MSDRLEPNSDNDDAYYENFTEDSNQDEEQADIDYEAASENWQNVLQTRYGDSPDEAVVQLAQHGDSLAEEYLLRKYKNIVRTKSRGYFLIGADHEDIVQEGMFGLFKAIRDYQPEKISSFKAFAEICVVRQMFTAIKAATRMKHAPLNTYVSLNKPIYDEDTGRTLLDVLTEKHMQNPEDMIINQETSIDFQMEAQKVLSPLEKRVLAVYLEGKSYRDIAKAMNRSPKSIDNALQRVKKKLEKSLHDIHSLDNE